MEVILIIVVLVFVVPLALNILKAVLVFLANHFSSIIRLLSYVSILVFLFSAIIGLREWRRLHLRNKAYQAISMEKRNDNPDFNLVAKKYETFLKKQPFLMKDNRGEILGKIYQEMYAEWFVRTPQFADTEIEKRFDLLKKSYAN